MKLIVGLGNPGEKYEYSRHNIGFLVCDELSSRNNISYKQNENFNSKVGDGLIEGEKIIITKPQTYMNVSGESVLKIKNYYKLTDDDVWVVHDDIDLGLGIIKIQFGGSSAGHRGIQSIIDLVGENFWRIRVGIGRDQNVPVEKWVLMDFENRGVIQKIIDRTCDYMIESLVSEIKETKINVGV